MARSYSAGEGSAFSAKPNVQPSTYDVASNEFSKLGFFDKGILNSISTSYPSGRSVNYSVVDRADQELIKGNKYSLRILPEVKEALEHSNYKTAEVRSNEAFERFVDKLGDKILDKSNEFQSKSDEQVRKYAKIMADSNGKDRELAKPYLNKAIAFASVAGALSTLSKQFLDEYFSKDWKSSGDARVRVPSIIIDEFKEGAKKHLYNNINWK